MVFSGLVTAWRLAGWPTSRSPSSVKATIEGVVRMPSAFSITFGVLPSMTATQELVVPRSMPMTLPMVLSSHLRQAGRAFERPNGSGGSTANPPDPAPWIRNSPRVCGSMAHIGGAQTPQDAEVGVFPPSVDQNFTVLRRLGPAHCRAERRGRSGSARRSGGRCTGCPAAASTRCDLPRIARLQQHLVVAHDVACFSIDGGQILAELGVGGSERQHVLGPSWNEAFEADAAVHIGRDLVTVRRESRRARTD